MRSQFNQSIGNLSHDSGVLIPPKSNTHSRNPSSTSSCYQSTIEAAEAKPSRNCRCKLVILIVGILLSLSCLLTYVYFPLVVRHLIQKIINLQPNQEFYDFWLKSSEPTEVGIYFFHVENPWAVENGIEKLRVKEMGTYMFKQVFEREIHEYSDDTKLVNFTERRWFYLDEDKTTGSLDDNITVVNVPYAALSSLLPKYVDGGFMAVPMLSSFSLFTHFSYRTINEFLEKHNQNLFINTTIRELLFGYRLDILDTAESYSGMLKKFGVDIMPTKLFPNNSFGILNGRNGTPDGPYEMYTGLGGSQDQFAMFKTWQGKAKLNNWNGETCNMLNGTDGTMWPAGVKQNDRLYFFVADICRSLYLTFQEESQYKGISTYVFSAPDEALAGKRTNPENACFCTEEDEELAEKYCTLDGVIDISACQNGIPLVVSLPHFLNADSRITDQIDGLKPNATKHRPELHVEPLMGTVIHGDSRLQMSIRVPYNENLLGFDKLKEDLYLPIFWGYKKLGMSDEMAAKLKWRLFYVVKFVNSVLIIGMISGSICILLWLMLKIVNYKNSMHQQNFIIIPTFNTNVQVDREFEKIKMLSHDGSETSDLGDNKSEDNSLSNTPRSSTFELERLVKSPETEI